MTRITNLIFEYSIQFKVRFLFIPCCILLLTSTPLFAEHFDFDSIHQKVYLEISQLKIIEAKRTILELKVAKRDNLATLFVEDFSEFLSVIALSSNEAFEYYKSRNSERIARLKNAKTASPYLRFSISEFYLHRGICRLLFNEKIKAVFDLKSSQSHILENIERYPQFRINYKTESLLNIIFGSIPPTFKWASALMSLKGNYNEGISELNQALNYSYLNPEYACFFPEILTYKTIITQLSSPIEAADRKMLNSFYSTLTVKTELKENHLLIYAWSDFLIKNQKNDLAIALLKNRQFGPSYLPFWPLEFLLGVALQNKLDNECISHFNNYINGVKKGNYINASYQRLAWQYLINNKTAEYYRYIQKISKEYNNTEQDYAAYVEASIFSTPNPNLLKARILYDGGYYAQSQMELEKIMPSALNSSLLQTEYFYRQGRICEKKENFQKAIFLYNKVITEETATPNYYAANAALNMGNIYEKLKDLKRARAYYIKCLSLKPNLYKESIHQKAKIGLERIK